MKLASTLQLFAALSVCTQFQSCVGVQHRLRSHMDVSQSTALSGSDLSATYVGCFDDSDMTIRQARMQVFGDKLIMHENGITKPIEGCMNYCSGKQGAKYFGLQMQMECWCFSSISEYTKTPETDCNMRCLNTDPNYMCGNNYRNSMYTISTECASGTFERSDYVCQACTPVPNCSSSPTCSTATNSVCPSGNCNKGYYSQAGACPACSSAMKGCSACSSSSRCTECQSKFYLNSLGCTACSSAMKSCSACSSSSRCTECQSKFYLNSDSKGCTACSSDAPANMIQDADNFGSTCSKNEYSFSGYVPSGVWSDSSSSIAVTSVEKIRFSGGTIKQHKGSCTGSASTCVSGSYDITAVYRLRNSVGQYVPNDGNANFVAVAKSGNTNYMVQFAIRLDSDGTASTRTAQDGGASWWWGNGRRPGKITTDSVDATTTSGAYDLLVGSSGTKYAVTTSSSCSYSDGCLSLANLKIALAK